MKIRAILERDISVPTSVDYEDYPVQLPNGETDYIVVTIEGNAITEYDPYNTGDSPSIGTFEPTRVFNKETGEELELQAFIKSLDDKSYQWIINQACENAN
jgi:hypothetical protein